MKLGILGGTFDPIHNGHLFLAEEARVQFKLDRVIVIPNGTPPHKERTHLTSPKHRLEMVKRAVAGNSSLVFSDIEALKPTVSYTFDTLCRLKQSYTEATLHYIIGADAMAEFLTWHRHEELIGMARFLCASRPGHDLDELKERLPAPYLEQIDHLSNMKLDISSTELRERLHKGAAVRYLLPDTVCTY